MSWLSWPFRMLFFLLWFAKEIVVSSAAVMRDNLTPGQSSTPGIVRLRTRCRTDVEVTLLAATITLTPGTLTLGIQRDPDDGARVLADLERVEADLHAYSRTVAGHVRLAFFSTAMRGLAAPVTRRTTTPASPSSSSRPSSARSPVRILPRRPARLHTARAGAATPPPAPIRSHRRAPARWPTSKLRSSTVVNPTSRVDASEVSS